MIEWLKVKFLNAFIDPQRRKHVVSRVLEGLTGTTVCYALAYLPFPWNLVAIPAGVVAEYAIYEYVLEPEGRRRHWFTTGHYWERAPRDGETFKIG